MYIPTWLIIVIAIGIFFYFRTKGNKASKIDKMWTQAEESMAAILEISQGKNYLEDKAKTIKNMERDVIRLRERYKYDKDKLEQIAHDWLDFSIALLKIVRAEILDELKSSVGYHNNGDGLKEYHEEIKEPNITIQEITNRVEELLGEDSSSKSDHERVKNTGKTGERKNLKKGKR